MTEPKAAKDALLPCPFCGCKEIKQWKVKHEDGVILHTVRCSGCHEGMDGHATAAGVAEKWNTRAQPGQAPSNQPAIAELIAVLIDLNNTRHAQNAIHKFLPDTLDDLFNKYESKYGMTYFDMTAPPLTPASDHCKDCCCAKAWWALGVSEYDGKSIAEHITELRFKNQELHKYIDQLFVAPASDIPGLREAVAELPENVFAAKGQPKYAVAAFKDMRRHVWAAMKKDGFTGEWHQYLVSLIETASWVERHRSTLMQTARQVAAGQVGGEKCAACTNIALPGVCLCNECGTKADAPADLDALKADASRNYSRTDYCMNNGWRYVIGWTIDHLASTGRLSGVTKS